MFSLVGENIKADSSRGNLQVHEEEGAHHQQEATQVGVEVHDHKQDAEPCGGVQPVQPISFHILFILHYGSALCVHPHVLVCLTRVDESAVLCWILIHWEVVYGVLIGQWSWDRNLLCGDWWVLSDSSCWCRGGGACGRQRCLAVDEKITPIPKVLVTSKHTTKSKKICRDV